MWRAAASRLLLRRLPSPASASHALLHRVPSSAPRQGPAQTKPELELEVTHAEARRLVRLVGVEALKCRLRETQDEVVGYTDLLDACLEAGAARTRAEAEALVRAMDDAGVLLLFRDKAYLYPAKVADLVRRAMPPLQLEHDPRKEEFKQLQKRKEEIDKLAHKQVRRILWFGLGFFICKIGLFFRLTFWEFSWKVMGTMAFFTTASGLVVGYAYFLITSRNPTYRNFRERLFSSRQRKLCAMHKFDMERYVELHKKYRCSL